MPDNSFKPKTPKVVATPPTAPAPTKATPPTYKGPYVPCTPNTAPADTIPAIPRHPGHTRHPTPNRAPENPAKPPPATPITFQPATPAKRDPLRPFKSINRPSLSAYSTPFQPQSVSPIAARHTRIARGCIGPRYGDIQNRKAHG